MTTDIKLNSKEPSASQIKDSNIDKNLKAELSSESLPADWDKGPVIKLVGTNFNAITMDVGKHVFVDFYAEWCGFCRILDPIWTKLAEHFKSSPDIVIAKIDGTLNELPGIELITFPTLRLFRKGDNKVIEFTKQRTLAKLIAFVENSGELSPTPHESEEEEAGNKEADPEKSTEMKESGEKSLPEKSTSAAIDLAPPEPQSTQPTPKHVKSKKKKSKSIKK